MPNIRRSKSTRINFGSPIIPRKNWKVVNIESGDGSETFVFHIRNVIQDEQDEDRRVIYDEVEQDGINTRVIIDTANLREGMHSLFIFDDDGDRLIETHDFSIVEERDNIRKAYELMIGLGDDSPQNLYDLDSKAILRLYENWDISVSDAIDESEKGSDVDWSDEDERWDDSGRDLSFIKRLGNYQTFVEDHLLNFWRAFNPQGVSKLNGFEVAAGYADFDVNLFIWMLKNTAHLLADFLNLVYEYSIRIHWTKEYFIFQISPLISEGSAISRLSIDHPFPEMIDWEQRSSEVSEREAVEIVMRDFVEHPAIDAMRTANQGRFKIAQEEMSLVYALTVSHGRALAAA